MSVITLDRGDSLRFTFSFTDDGGVADLSGQLLEVYDVSPALEGHVLASWNNAQIGSVLVFIISDPEVPIDDTQSFRVRTYPVGLPDEAWAAPKFKVIYR